MLTCSRNSPVSKQVVLIELMFCQPAVLLEKIIRTRVVYVPLVAMQIQEYLNGKHVPIKLKFKSNRLCYSHHNLEASDSLGSPVELVRERGPMENNPIFHST